MRNPTEGRRESIMQWSKGIVAIPQRLHIQAKPAARKYKNILEAENKMWEVFSSSLPTLNDKQAAREAVMEIRINLLCLVIRAHFSDRQQAC